jgi:DNA polymerase-3 subunit gamma/tau
VAQQYALGIEPIAMMRAQMDIVHKVTVAQIGGSGSDTRSPEERAAIEGWARDLAAGQLHRLWQLLLKGYEEVKTAPDPLVAAQMALLRVLHAADMPDPGSLVKKLEDIASRPVVMAAAPAGENGDGSGGGSPAACSRTGARGAGLGGTGRAGGASRAAGRIVDAAVRAGDRVARRVSALSVGAGAAGRSFGRHRKALQRDRRAVAGGRDDAVSSGEAQPSRGNHGSSAAHQAMLEDPLVKAAFAAFPDAKIIDEDSSREHQARPWGQSRSRHA